MNYTIEKHNHNLAAWVAATAARASNKCRFSVEHGREILEKSGFTESFSLSDLPNPENHDSWHEEKRRKVIDAAKSDTKKFRGLKFSDGISAKLINCYLKARFVCGGHHDDPRVQAIHPPIDAVLLEGLRKSDPPVTGQDEWQKHRNTRWSKLTSDGYQEIIDLVRKTMDGKPLWMIEEYWQGHQ